jgi:recombination DNA repair RAD52 pathway protein
MMPFNDRQLEQLFRPINPSRVAERKGMSYLETWDVLAHLNRIFGFEGWDKEVLTCEMIYEEFTTWKTPQGQEKSGWDVAYRATVALVIKDRDGWEVKRSEDVATGQAQHQPSRGDAHDLAVKSAVSDALKRAAKDLGNQFGLSLYASGSTQSVVGTSLAYPEEPTLPAAQTPEVVREQVAELRDKMLGERDTPELIDSSNST